MSTCNVQILDSTLREGEQSLGVCFSLSEKKEVIEGLKRFGVTLIEIGHPGISAVERNMCRDICASITDVEFLVHARACEADVMAAIETNASWVGIWASYNDISLETKFNNKSREWVKVQVEHAIMLAKKNGLNVRFTIEDTSRTDISLIRELGMAAVKAGADRISLADTVGAWHPNECAKAVKDAVEYFGVEIEVHLHNDLGLAQANAIAAIEAGASVIDASILGIGERAGICDVFILAATIEKFYHAKPFHWEHSPVLMQYVNRVGSFKSEPHRPIVGRNVFTHTSKYHIKAASNNPCAYESLDPKFFGTQRKHILNSLDRKETQRFLKTLQVKKPFVKGAAELKHHRDGVGERWVMMDSRVDERSSLYIIERAFDKDYRDEYQPHVDAHAHHCDSCFVFMGNEPDGTGLIVNVTFGEGDTQNTETFSSPASVFIPAYVVHTYEYVSGTGRFLNIVLSPSIMRACFKRVCLSL